MVARFPRQSEKRRKPARALFGLPPGQKKLRGGPWPPWRAPEEMPVPIPIPPAEWGGEMGSMRPGRVLFLICLSMAASEGIAHKPAVTP